MATTRSFVLPGEPIDQELIPSHKTRALKLGPGLRYLPPSDLVATKAGELVADHKKNSIWVDHPGGKYLPNQGDLVVGSVHHSAADMYYVTISEHAPTAILPHLSFEMATKKSRPVLATGALVYARVATASKHTDTELECVSAHTGKAEGLGPLVGGMPFTISLGMARRLLMPRSVEEGGVVVLQELENAGAAFETAVGRNGKLWVNSEALKTIIAVGRAITETDEKNLGVEMQKKLVRKIIKDMS